jgi:hypothetical protein
MTPDMMNAVVEEGRRTTAAFAMSAPVIVANER